MRNGILMYMRKEMYGRPELRNQLSNFQVFNTKRYKIKSRVSFTESFPLVWKNAAFYTPY